MKLSELLDTIDKKLDKKTSDMLWYGSFAAIAVCSIIFLVFSLGKIYRPLPLTILLVLIDVVAVVILAFLTFKKTKGK